jgi:hypothetical protein
MSENGASLAFTLSYVVNNMVFLQETVMGNNILNN